VNVACRSILRFAEEDENGWSASALDVPNKGELKFPTGKPRFTLLKIFRAETENVKL